MHPQASSGIHRNRTISSTGSSIEAVAAGAGDDRIGAACMTLGGPGDDTLTGAAGDGDLVVGGDGDDRLAGGGGPDRLVGGAGADAPAGGAGADTLAGGRGDDRLSGDDGDDTYLFGSTAGRQRDRVAEAAGRGLDVLSFDLEAGSPVRVDLSTRPRVVAGRTSSSFEPSPEARFVEGAIGGKGDDRLVGHAGANHFWSGGGIASPQAGAATTSITSTGPARRRTGRTRGEGSGAVPSSAAPRTAAPSGSCARRHARFCVATRRRGGGFDTVGLSEQWLSSAVVGTRLEGQLDGARVDLAAPAWILRTPTVAAAAARRGGTRHLEGIRGTSSADVLIGNAASSVLAGRHAPDRVSGGRGRDTCLITQRDDLVRGCERVRSADPDR